MGPLKLAVMAWKNLWRQKRRTLITAFSIAFAILMSVFILGMNDQNWEDVINTAARIGGGHVTVQHPDYQEKPALSRTVQGTDAKIAKIQELEHVTHVLPRITGQVMLSSTTDSFGAGFMAYDPALESTETISILEAVKEGEVFKSADDKGIILGARLAKNLGVVMGDKVVYTMTNKEGDIVSGLARVSGLVKTGSPAVDLGLCFLPIGAAQQTLGYGADEAIQIAVFVDFSRNAPDTAETVGGLLDDGAVALTWKEAQPDLDGFIAMKKGGGTFFALLMLLLCAAGIFNTLFVSVMERLREFGILMAIGLSPLKLFGLVIWESLWLGIVGIFGGVLLSAYPYYYMSTVGMDLTEVYASSGQKMDIAGVGMNTIFKIGLYPSSAVAIVIAVLAAVLISGLYPAYKAGKVEPVETIKIV